MVNISDKREEQRLLLDSSPNLELGDVASCNLTMLQGGNQVNLLAEAANYHIITFLSSNYHIITF